MHYVCMYLIYSNRTLNKSTPSLPNPLNANHELAKTESFRQPEVKTSDTGNKNPPHQYRILESEPQQVRYFV